LPVEQNETAWFSHNHHGNQQKTRIGVWDGPEKGQFCWSRKKTGEKCKGVVGREVTGKEEEGVSCRHAVGDEGGEVAQGSWDIRV
jgi:hypothetical protein